MSSEPAGSRSLHRLVRKFILLLGIVLGFQATSFVD